MSHSILKIKKMIWEALESGKDRMDTGKKSLDLAVKQTLVTETQQL